MKNKFPTYIQSDAKDCGPACLRIVAKFYGKLISLQEIRNLSETTREGTSLLGLSIAAEKIGFKTLGVQIDFNTLKEDIILPNISLWNKNHFIVVYKIDSSNCVYVSDPSFGLLKYSKDEFIQGWIGKNADEETNEGISLIIETTPLFFKNEFISEKDTKLSFSFLFKYLLKYKALIVQLALGLLAGSMLSLILPFLTQSVVDVGIQGQDISFIYLVFIAQIMIFIGRTVIEVIRSWILLHLTTRINISILSDFFIKLMKLPISFFDTRMTGDIMQRVNDHKRIEQLLTTTSLNSLFALVNFVVFGIILLYYDYWIFLTYIIGALTYVIWIILFLKKRKELDYKTFSQVSQEQSTVIEIVNGMQDIKMYNAEQIKRWKWEFIQIKIFNINIKVLSLEQWQSVGGTFINQMKDITVSFLSAKMVLEGNLTLGMMLSVQYIIGQLNNPLSQLIDFIKRLQDASIALERLGEIHSKENEEKTEEQYLRDIPEADINIIDASFRYLGSPDFIFKNLNLKIPYKKTTAIVGVSGSGKTTLLKLLTKFYDLTEGEIKVGNCNLKNISTEVWREHCGVVMQDGHIFNDTIAENIALGNDIIDKEKLRLAADIANIRQFIENLPLGYNTLIGSEGVGISGGQRQRIFIARAIYKSPKFILFDEATSALDANNEKTITKNLEGFLGNKTAIIIAHRLSTVKNADNIVVLDKGCVVEQGTHEELVNLKGVFYKLIKNQLELGS